MLIALEVPLGEHVSCGNILHRLIAELEILLDRDGILDLEPDDRGGKEESTREKTPLEYSVSTTPISTI